MKLGVRLANVFKWSDFKKYNFSIRAHRNYSISASQAVNMSENEADISKFHGSQVSLLKEMCIEIDENDVPIQAISKGNCHLMKNIKKGLLHRAFSLFLFNTNGELLLQQRSDIKITFPGFYTNTCCSHPLYTQEELDKQDHIGAKRAVQRRLFQELGVDPKELPLDAIHFVTKIHYKAPYNEAWGEHEIDYIMIAQQDVTLKPNPDEVKNYKYVSKHEILDFLASLNSPLTPWFKLILDKFLFKWWAKLDNVKSLEDNVIHRTV